jgi:hypothetical protein
VAAARSLGEGGAAEPRSRALLVLLLLLIVGLPLAVVGSLMGSRGMLPATVGDQPGGEIEGRLLDPEGRPLAGATVLLSLLPDGAPSEPQAEVETAGDGTFSFTAPPVRGKYALSAGGGEYVRTVRELSFLDPRGETVELEPVELQLEPGCVLTVRLERASDRYDDSGRYELHGRMLEGWALGLIRPSLRKTGEFEDGVVEIGGLPPLDGRLILFLDNGDEVELPLRLEPGHTERVLPL